MLDIDYLIMIDYYLLIISLNRQRQDTVEATNGANH